MRVSLSQIPRTAVTGGSQLSKRAANAASNRSHLNRRTSRSALASLRPAATIRRTQSSLSVSNFHHSARNLDSNQNSRRKKPSEISLLGTTYKTDDRTNVPNSILSRLAPSPTLPYKSSHPLNLLRSDIESHFSRTKAIKAPSPIVTKELNFDELGFPEDHPGRNPSDTYYINKDLCLRTHTSAHEIQTFRDGHDRWLLTADVYRRDEIDSSHYPIFHQMEGAAIFNLDQDFGNKSNSSIEKECEEMESKLRSSEIKLEIQDDVDIKEAGDWQANHDVEKAKLVTRHLKASLNGLVLHLFGERHEFESRDSGKDKEKNQPLKVRWISATFPFTSPSFEVEVWFRGKWLEILGCGVVMQKTLDTAGVQNKIGWAFGLGLERIAMVLYSIPDIRLFWSEDERFLKQFRMEEESTGETESITKNPSGGSTSSPKRRKLVTFKPYSKHPACLRDVSFWLKEVKDGESRRKFHDNDFFEIVRDQVSDLVEDVSLIDEFKNPKTGRTSKCFRINYRSMDRNLESEEVNALHSKVVDRLVNELGIEIR